MRHLCGPTWEGRPQINAHRDESDERNQMARSPLVHAFIVWAIAGVMATAIFSPNAKLHAQELTQQANATNCAGGAAPVAEVVSVKGEVARNDALATLDTLVCPGDRIAVGANSRAALYLLDRETVLRLDENTLFEVPPADEDQSILELLRGALYVFSRTPTRLDIRTAFVDGGIDGTEFEIRANLDPASGPVGTSIRVFEGVVTARNELGVIVTETGEVIFAAGACPGTPDTCGATAAPTPGIIEVRFEDAVAWTIHYPPVLPDPNDGLVPAPIAEAARLLDAGRYRAAERALAGSSDTASALALRTVIALALNRRDDALRFGEQATVADATSTAAKIALSYAQQGAFDLEAARDTLEQAVAGEPTNALAHARLAEIWLSLGYRTRALAAATTAQELAPNLSRTNSVLGFAMLSAIQIDRAKDAFSRAITADSDDPLPHLGLGLAHIRRGDIVTGRRLIEQASALGPASSLIRSYVGKALFEESHCSFSDLFGDFVGREACDPIGQAKDKNKRREDAETQFDIARDLDPNDPTPELYDAILEQFDGRPIEALRSIERSIALNDNRAVYRSRLLLDEDAAVRSASLARVYATLGFDQLALVEGFKSVTYDPGNFAGHRFLADTYATLPRHEIGRVSELLQSQIRQPINAAGIQPQLGESELFIVQGAAPATASFNEFTPLFVDNGISLEGGALVGGNKTRAGDVLVSGVYDWASVNVGHFDYSSAGYRENSDLDTTAQNMLVQAQLLPSTKVQFEIRKLESERGDLPLSFDPSNFVNNLRQFEETRSARLGLHHEFGPNLDIIANLQRQISEPRVDIVGATDLDVTDKGKSAEIQSLIKVGNTLYLQNIVSNVNFVVGGGYSSTERRDEVNFLFFPLNLLGPQITETKSHLKNGYIYGYFNILSKLSLTLGVSYDNFSGGIRNRIQLNPKIGVLWNPAPNTTLRLAAFRTLTKSLISDQTIEPAQVAGFNQFFSDTQGTNAWRYGLGIDQKFSTALSAIPSIYTGFEISTRSLNVPESIPGLTPSVAVNEFWEWLGRAYISVPIHNNFSTSIEAQREKFRRSFFAIIPSNQITKLRTDRIRFQANYFDTSGVRAGILGTYYRQRGDFGQVTGGPTIGGSDNFWLFDLTLGYQFPNQYGQIAFEVRNLLNQEFRFHDVNIRNPVLVPGQMIAFKIRLYF